jgi:hypothetical protein
VRAKLTGYREKGAAMTLATSGDRDQSTMSISTAILRAIASDDHADHAICSVRQFYSGRQVQKSLRLHPKGSNRP